MFYLLSYAPKRAKLAEIHDTKKTWSVKEETDDGTATLLHQRASRFPLGCLCARDPTGTVKGNELPPSVPNAYLPMLTPFIQTFQEKSGNRLQQCHIP
jgi:hypothetical protein